MSRVSEVRSEGESSSYKPITFRSEFDKLGRSCVSDHVDSVDTVATQNRRSVAVAKLNLNNARLFSYLFL